MTQVCSSGPRLGCRREYLGLIQTDFDANPPKYSNVQPRL